MDFDVKTIILYVPIFLSNLLKTIGDYLLLISHEKVSISTGKVLIILHLTKHISHSPTTFKTPLTIYLALFFYFD